MANYLELRQLLHELLLFFAIGEWRQNIQKDFEQVQALSRHAGQCEDRGDAVEGGREWADEQSSNRRQRLEPLHERQASLGVDRGSPLLFANQLRSLGPLSMSLAFETHLRAQRDGKRLAQHFASRFPGVSKAD